MMITSVGCNIRRTASRVRSRWGMVITVEPGLYSGARKSPEAYSGPAACASEDDVL